MRNRQPPAPYLAALLVIALSASHCATDRNARVEQVIDNIAGSWVNTRATPDRRGWRQALNVLDGLEAPEPLEIEFRKDGSFSATYSAKDFRTFMRMLNRVDLENPVAGHYAIGVDWSGTVWINAEPGAPERRITLDKGTLTLYSVGQVWRTENYRRPAAE